MEVTREQIGDITVVVLLGEHLDASNAKDFKRGVASLAESNSKVVLDLGKVQFVDSAGCGALLSFLRQLKSVGGDVKLCAATKAVRSLFELVRMHRVFDTFNTRDEAVKAYQV